MPETPQSFGQYDLLEQLGNSQTGAIWKARHRVMGRVVALKILSSRAAASNDFVERFRRKTKILAQFNHPNLVVAYEAGCEGDTFYLVTDYVDGQNLKAMLNAREPLPINEAVGYLTQAAEGLAYAHQHGVFHRDVKPGNLMVDSQGVIKVVGFGMAHIEADSTLATDGREDLTRQGQVLGTYDYMAPEQAVDSRQADQRSDIYSLGCTLHALLVGRAPYPGKSVMLQIMAHQTSPVPNLRAARGDVPEWLERLFEKMMAKRPEDRPQSMEEVITALAVGRAQQMTAAAGSRPADQASAMVADEGSLVGAPHAKPGFSWVSIGSMFAGTAVLGLILAWLTWYLLPGTKPRQVATNVKPQVAANGRGSSADIATAEKAVAQAVKPIAPNSKAAAWTEDDWSALVASPKTPGKPKKPASRNSASPGDRPKPKAAQKKPTDNRPKQADGKRKQDNRSAATEDTNDIASAHATGSASAIPSTNAGKAGGNRARTNVKRRQDERSPVAGDTNGIAPPPSQPPSKVQTPRHGPAQTPARDAESQFAQTGLTKRAGYFVLPEEAQFIRDMPSLEKLRVACYNTQKQLAQVQRQLDRVKSMKVATVQARLQAEHADRNSLTWWEHSRASAARNATLDAETLANLSAKDVEKLANDVRADLQQSVDALGKKCAQLRQTFTEMKAKYEDLSHDDAVRRALAEKASEGSPASALGPSPTALAAARKLDHEESLLAQFKKSLGKTLEPSTTKESK